MEKKQNIETLDELYKSVHTALMSISNFSTSTDDAKIKEELMAQHEGYEKLAGQISTLMAEFNAPPKEPNFMKKAILFSSIKVGTLTDSSNSRIADLMIRGTTMEKNKLTKTLNENMDMLDERVVSLANDIIQTKDKYIENLNSYL